MPNLETGHYFLTVLAPVRTGFSHGVDGLSYRQTLLEVLARMPHSETTPNSRGTAQHSPFARNRMTHLARFVLIDDTPYNGRETGDTLKGKLSNIDPLVRQPVDRLSNAFLVFAADFDAASGDESALRTFTDELWTTMKAELTAIFENCYGFEDVADQQGFFDYIKRCQVETTMPFNDYYPEDPRTLKLPPDMPLPLKAIATSAKVLLAVVVLWLASLLFAAILPEGGLRDLVAPVARWGSLVVLVLIVMAAIYIYSLYRRIMVQGAKPLPPSATLPEVLKSLYLQQYFTDFVIDNQRADAVALHAAFGKFLRDHAPDNLDKPTQTPGLISRAGQQLPTGAAG